MYLPEADGSLSSSSDEDHIRCNCGFSAMVNRRLSHRAGLFYEDEVEITGSLYVDENIDRKKTSLNSVSSAAGKRRGNELDGPGDTNNNNGSSNSSTSANTSITTPPEQSSGGVVDVIPQSVLELIRDQCVIIKSAVNALVKTSVRNCKSSDSLLWTLNKLEFSDGNEISLIALDQGRHSNEMMHTCKMSSEDFRLRGGNAPLHRWQFLRAGGPNCNQDIIRIMRQLQPLLQEAVQKKCTTRLWEAPYTVSGPLTWRQFHRLAGRG
jgi:mediator of RNA polymerase II transcription subunit 13